MTYAKLINCKHLQKQNVTEMDALNFHHELITFPRTKIAHTKALNRCIFFYFKFPIFFVFEFQ